MHKFGILNFVFILWALSSSAADKNKIENFQQLNCSHIESSGESQMPTGWQATVKTSKSKTTVDLVEVQGELKECYQFEGAAFSSNQSVSLLFKGWKQSCAGLLLDSDKKGSCRFTLNHDKSGDDKKRNPIQLKGECAFDGAFGADPDYNRNKGMKKIDLECSAENK